MTTAAYTRACQPEITAEIISSWNAFKSRSDIEARYGLHPTMLSRILKANGLSGKRPPAKEQRLAQEMATTYEQEFQWKEEGVEYKTLEVNGILITVTEKGGIWSVRRNRFLTPAINKGGYSVVGVNGKNYYVHRLVAEAFIPNPDNLPTVDHIYPDKQNNHVSNLQWLTTEENSSKGNKVH